jgi:hypothetical protein
MRELEDIPDCVWPLRSSCARRSTSAALAGSVLSLMVLSGACAMALAALKSSGNTSIDIFFIVLFRQ